MEDIHANALHILAKFISFQDLSSLEIPQWTELDSKKKINQLGFELLLNLVKISNAKLLDQIEDNDIIKKDSTAEIHELPIEMLLEIFENLSLHDVVKGLIDDL